MLRRTGHAMRQIIIGREGNQPFTITDEYVSRQHAVFTYDEATGAMTLTDKSRPEVGTFVKTGTAYRQVSQCRVDADTEVRLGPYFVFRIGQLLQSPQPLAGQPANSLRAGSAQQPAKEDISYLRKVAENYEKTKLQLEQKQASINSLRTLSLVGSFAGGGISAIIPKVMGDSQDLYVLLIGPIIAVVFLVVLMMYCSKVSRDVIVKKNKNEKNYKISFCCPKCHVPFAGKLYENILAEGRCPKCKVPFYESES